MCVVSGVFDYWGKYPWPFDQPRIPLQPRVPLLPDYERPPLFPEWNPTSEQLKELAEVIEKFKRSVKAARTVDELTGQPDCDDPEKLKLEKRIQQLERQIRKLKKRKK